MWYIIYQEKIKVKKPIQLTPTPDTLINLHPGNTDHLFLHKTLDLYQENTPLNNLLWQGSQENTPLNCPVRLADKPWLKILLVDLL